MRNLSAFQPSGNTKAYYPLNNNSNDYSGNLNTGTPTDITYPQGRFGQGAKFNGSSSYVDGGNGSALQFTNTTPFTGSAWIKTTGANDWNCIMAKMKNSGDFKGWFFSTRNHTTNTLFVNLVNTTTNYFERIGGVNVNDNRWHHVLFTYDGGNVASGVNIYVDGRLAPLSTGVNNTLSGTIANAVNFRLGSRDGGGLIYSGDIDEVIIESRAWTAKEVETYYRKSNLNYRQKTFGQVVYTYISELLKGQYTLSGKQLNPLYNRVVQLAKGAFALTGKQLSVAKAYTAQLGAGVFNLVGKALTVPRRWANQVKSATSWTEQTKNSATWTNQDKS